jgi:anaerobic magnesium-protoporphyrin IX monomethyl ester cyclase
LKALIRRTTLGDIESASSALRRNGIIVTYNLLMFHPNATTMEIEKNMDFIEEHIDLPFDFGRAEVVSGSPLEIMLLKGKKLIDMWPVHDYLIKDETVEKMFRLNAITFRKSPYSRMIHMLIALCYRAYMLERLYPGRVTARLKGETHHLVSEINGFIREELYSILDLAMKGSTTSQEIHSKIQEKSNEFIKSIKRLDNRMLRLQIAEKVFMRFGLENLAQDRLFGYIFQY